MRATAVVPVKRFAAAKRRLGDALEPAAREALLEAMLRDALQAIARAAQVERTIVVSGEPRAAALAGELGCELLEDERDEGHPQAATRGAAQARASGAEAVAMLPGDCPLIDPAELDALLADLEPPCVAVVPDRHGTGTNGLVLAPPDAIAPAFGPDSRARHEALAGEANVPARTEPLPSLALDLDTPDDLGALREELRNDPPRAPATAAALRP